MFTDKQAPFPSLHRWPSVFIRGSFLLFIRAPSCHSWLPYFRSRRRTPPYFAGEITSFTSVPSGGSTDLFVSILISDESFSVRFDWITTSAVTGKTVIRFIASSAPYTFSGLFGSSCFIADPQNFHLSAGIALPVFLSISVFSIGTLLPLGNKTETFTSGP